MKVRVHGGSKHSFNHNNRTHDMSVDYGEHERDMEVWLDKSGDMKKVYEELFGEAIEQYNEKQGIKHKERQTSVEEYLYKQQHTLVKSAKKGEYEEENQECFELIVSVGSIEDQPDRDLQKEILKEFYDSWEENYPNLKLVQVAYHGDEKGVPHLHIDYIPIAHKDKGLPVQIEWKAATKEMGIEWEEKQTYINKKNEEKTKVVGGKEVIHSMIRNDFAELCRSKGLEINLESKIDREELDVWDYKRQQAKKNIETANKQLQALNEEIQDKVGEVKKINEKHINKPDMNIYDLPTKEIGMVKKETYVKFEDIEQYKEQTDKIVAKAKDIIWANEHNKGVEVHSQWKAKELEQKLEHYRKDDLVKENETLREENSKLKTREEEYKKMYIREKGEHENTKEQLRNTENSLNWYQSMYKQLIKFIDKLQMNGNSLLNHFIKDKPQKIQDYIKQDINKIHQEEIEQQQYTHKYHGPSL